MVAITSCEGIAGRYIDQEFTAIKTEKGHVHNGVLRVFGFNRVKVVLVWQVMGGKGGGGRGDDGGRNPNRGRGQRQDMKSLKTGSYSFDSKYV